MDSRALLPNTPGRMLTTSEVMHLIPEISVVRSSHDIETTRASTMQLTAAISSVSAGIERIRVRDCRGPSRGFLTHEDPRLRYGVGLGRSVDDVDLMLYDDNRINNTGV